MRKLGALQLVVLAIYVGAATLVYPTLPERIPTHFTIYGEPDDWSRTSFWSWFALPVICVVISAFFHVIGAISERYPAAFNVPDKDKYLALSRAERAPVISTMRTFLEVMTLEMTVLFAALQAGMYEVASGGGEALPWYSKTMLLVVVLSPTMLLPFLYVRVTNQIQRAVKRQASTAGL